MPWLRIDEHALNHVKVLALSHPAFRLWVEGLAHCQLHLTDGQIKGAALKTFRYVTPARTAELLTVGLWDATEGGIHVHDYLTWNEPRDKVLKDRELAKHRWQRFKQRVHNGVGDALPTGVHDHVHVHTTERSSRSRVFTGGRLKVSQAQHRIVLDELGPKSPLVPELLAKYAQWDVDLQASGEAFDTLEYIKRRALECAKALRAGGPLYQNLDYCQHEPRCHSRTWHEAKAADEAEKRQTG